MKTTLLKNISIFCVLALSVGALNAQISTFTGTTDTTFETATNWSLGTMPNGNTRALIPNGSNVIYNVALSTIDAGNTSSYIMHLNMEKDATFTVSQKLWVYANNSTPIAPETRVDGNYSGGNLILEAGADMNFRRNFYWGTSTNAGTLTVNGGILNNKNVFVIGENGNGTLIINGGTVSTEAGNFIVGGYTGYGSIILNGGLLNAKPAIDIDARADRAGAGHIAVDAGTINMVGDLSTTVTGWITDGKLKAVAGKKINVEIIPAVADDPFATPPVVAAPAKTIVTAVADSAKEVAYLTTNATMGAGASAVDNDAIIRMLQADANFNVTVLQNPAGGTDLSGYDLVIAQETLGSSDAIWDGLVDVQNITVPTIINKAYAWQANKNHISSVASAVIKSASLSISVPDAVRRADPLFSGIDFAGGNYIQLFNDLSIDDIGTAGGGANGIHVLNDIEITQAANGIGGTSATLHATVADVTTPAAAAVFNELRKGTQIGTDVADVLQAPVITFGMSYGAIALGDGTNITSEALTIWRNAAYHLTGMMSPSTLYINPALSIDKAGSVSNVTTDVKAIGNRVFVSNVKSASEINIYSITGALVKSFKTNEDTNFELRSGLWIATVKTFEGQKSVKLLLK